MGNVFGLQLVGANQNGNLFGFQRSEAIVRLSKSENRFGLQPVGANQNGESFKAPQNLLKAHVWGYMH